MSTRFDTARRGGPLRGGGVARGVVRGGLIVALGAAACGEERAPPGPPPTAAPQLAGRVSQPAAAAPWASRRCPVGELCEAAAPIDGWRLPERCEIEHRGRWSTRCRLTRTPLSMARRFLVTRYRPVVDEGTALVARPRDGGDGPGGPRIAARQVQADVIITTAGRPEPLDVPRPVTAAR
jgi:hypothetical protein